MIATKTPTPINPDNIMSFALAQRTVDFYVCGCCWGPLINLAVPGEPKQRHVTCLECGDGRGFITRKSAQRRIEENRMQYIVARSNLRAYFEPGPRKTAQAIIKEMGF